MKEYAGTFEVKCYVDFFVEAETEEEAKNKILEEYTDMDIGDFKDIDGEMVKFECLD